MRCDPQKEPAAIFWYSWRTQTILATVLETDYMHVVDKS